MGLNKWRVEGRISSWRLCKGRRGRSDLKAVTRTHTHTHTLPLSLTHTHTGATCDAGGGEAAKGGGERERRGGTGKSKTGRADCAREGGNTSRVARGK
jgi:hypothetical protein